MKQLLSITFIILLAANVSAQVFNANLRAGDAAYERGDFHQAMAYYGTALEYEEDNDVLFKYAESAFSFDAYKQAKSAYAKVLKDRKGVHYQESLFKLAQVNQLRGDYRNAIKYFERYLKAKDTNEEQKKAAEKHVNDCKWAAELATNEQIDFQKLGEDVNTLFSEFSPFLSGDNLFYSTAILDQEDASTQRRIYIQSDGDQGMPLDGPFNNDFQNAGHLSLNADGSMAVFTVCSNVGVQLESCALYLTRMQEDLTWSKAEKLPDFINVQASNNTQASFGKNANGKSGLFFISDRKEGKGGTDIWFSEIKNGAYLSPVNVSSLNTEKHEYAPSYHEASESLYFSSDGYQSLGGLDIYKSKIQNEAFAEAENLGLPINSSYNDLFYHLSPDGTQAYLSSNRLGSEYIDDLNEACCYDIYKADKLISELNFIVSTLERGSNESLNGVKLEVRNKTHNEKIDYLSIENNEYDLIVKNAEDYEIIASKEGYENQSYTFQASHKLKDTKLYLEKKKAEYTEISAEILDENEKPLFSATTCIHNLSKDERDCFNSQDKNEYIKKLNSTDDYMIITTRLAYEDDTLLINAADLSSGELLTKVITLRKKKAAIVSKLSLDGYLPLPLYFDNDKPDSNTKNKITQRSYQETYNNYYARKQTYLTQNAEILNGEERIMTEAKVENFFEQNVRGGYNSLDGFCNQLLKYLIQNNSAIIVLKGYASPRANSDYNKFLTMRRVNSVRNHFQKWNGGVLLLYLNNGSLKIIEESFGEADSSINVSDDLIDKKNSIYSIEASLERRVEIIEIKGN